MEKQFQSKSVPRGTRTIWRYLGALFILFTFAIGQSWADEEIIKVVLSGSNGATKTMSGTIGGTCAVDKLGSSSPYKLNSNGAYVSLTLAAGYFEPTDIVTITGADGAHQIYYGTPTSGTLLCTTGAPSSGTITCKLKGLPANQNTIYVYRASDTYNKKVATMAVTRPDPLPITGTASVTYTLASNSANVEGEATVSTITADDASSFTTSTLTVTSGNSKTGYSGQIKGFTASQEYNASNYVALGFSVASGYTFEPSNASLTVFANDCTPSAKVVISDGETTIESNGVACAKSADTQITFESGTFSAGKKLSGDVTIKVYFWGASGDKRAYIKSPVTITGTVAAAAPKYDVVFANGGEGTGDMATLKYEAGEEVTLPACGYTPVAGREFAGWSSSDVTISAGKFEMPAKNVTITATWRDEAVKYTIAYDVNGGSSAPPTETDKAAGDEFALAAAPEYEGYHFEGWLCDADAVTYDAEDAYTMTAANTTFTAQWKPYSTISIANKTYIIGSGNFNAVSDFSSNSDGEVTYALKEAYTGVTLSNAGVFSATVAGDYIVVANQAANATYAATSKEFTVTVLDNELSDTYVWKKNASYTGCIANPNADAPVAQYTDIAYEGFTGMGRAAADNTECILTFTVKAAYSTNFGIKSICTYGKLEEPAGGQISWDGGANWEDLAAYAEGKKEFNAPAATFPTSFKIRFLGVSASSGGLYWRNALVTLEVKKTVTGVTETLVGAEINGAAISSENLATLLEDKTLDIATAYAAAPTVTFKKQVTTSYEGGWADDVTSEEIDVEASDITTAWSASTTINSQAYTVTLAKPAGPSLETEATAFTLTSAKVATDTKKFTFSGVNLTSGNVTISLESAVAGMTVTPAAVTPIEGAITDQEITITYKSLENVAEAVVNLIVAYDEDTKITIPLTYSSTAGYEDLTSISAATTWDWENANSSTEAIESLDANEIVVLANYSGWVDAFKANSIAGKLQYVYRGNNYAQGHSLKFNTTVPGIVTVTFSNTSTKEVARAPRITDVNGSYAPTDEADGAKTADKKSYSHAVAAGDVLIEGFEMQTGTPANMLRYYEVRFVPTYSVTYMPNGGSGAEYIIDDAATEVRAGSIFTAPASSIFAGWNTKANGEGDAYAAGDAVTEDLVLYAQWSSYFTITYMDGETQLDTEDVLEGDAPVGIADPVKFGYDFAGWTLAGSDDVINVTTLTTATTVYAKWEAIDACFYFSAKSVTEDEAITTPANLDNAFGGTVEATSGTFTYTQYGVLIADGGDKYFTVNLDYALQEGSKIALKLYAGGTSERGLNLRVAGSSSNVYQYKWNPSGTEPAQMEYEYEYVVPENSPLIGKKVFYLYRNNNVYLQTITVKDCAPQDYTVTYKDGETVLGTEQVFENAHPTADGINTHKKGYEFQGWAETADGDVVDLDDITITAAKNLFAQYTVKDCSPKGIKFSMAIDGSKISANQYYPATTPAVGDLAVFATVTGGVAQAVNTSTGTTKNFEVKTTPEFKLGGNNSHMRILLDCPLAENDTIKFTKTERITLSFDSLKTKSENIAKTTSYYIVPAKYAGEDTIHIWYNSNGVSVNGVQVIRPEVYSVSFNLMDHGSAIADITGVVKGAKITAPTAPTDEDYAFAGWYKENTLENEWDFANDVVNDNIILYAKWLDKSDATLKSLKYGSTEIALEEGVFEYNIGLPSSTVSVPALTAETSNPNASKEITNAAAFDESGNAQSVVVVTPEMAGAATQTYTVNFTVLPALPQTNVTGTTEWNFSVAGSTSLTNQSDIVLANLPGIVNDETFNSQALFGSFNKLPGDGHSYQGSKLSFTAEVAGYLTIEFSGTNGNARHLQVCTGDGETVIADWDYNSSSTHQTKSVEVPAGKVTLKAFEGEAAQNARIYKMTFNALVDQRGAGWAAAGELGTVCLESDAFVTGANLYELQGLNENGYLTFDQITNGQLEAGKPYLFEATSNALINFYAPVGAETTETAGNTNGMHGTFTNKTFTATDENIYYFSGRHIWAVKDFTVGITIPAHLCYVNMQELKDAGQASANPAPGRRRVVLGVKGTQTATGIDELNASEKPMKMIINGQLFIIRGEKMYDAKGQLVK